MGNQDDGLSVLAHLTQRVEKHLRLLRRQHSGRFVQNQNLRAQIDGAQNFHTLLLAHGKLPDLAVGIDLHVIPVRQRPQLLRCFACVEQNAAA